MIVPITIEMAEPKPIERFRLLLGCLSAIIISSMKKAWAYLIITWAYLIIMSRFRLWIICMPKLLKFNGKNLS